MNRLRGLLSRRAETPNPATCFREESWNSGRVEEALPCLQLSHEFLVQLDAHDQALPRPLLNDELFAHRDRHIL